MPHTKQEGGRIIQIRQMPVGRERLIRIIRFKAHSQFFKEGPNDANLAFDIVSVHFTELVLHVARVVDLHLTSKPKNGLHSHRNRQRVPWGCSCPPP